MRRNFRGFTFFLAMLYQLFVAVPKNAFMYALKADIRYIRAYSIGVMWHAVHMFDKKIHKSPRLRNKINHYGYHYIHI